MKGILAGMIIGGAIAYIMARLGYPLYTKIPDGKLIWKNYIIFLIIACPLAYGIVLGLEHYNK